MRRFIFSAGLVLGWAMQSWGAQVSYDVHPAEGAASPVRVIVGTSVSYEVTITVSEFDNEGLLLFIFDLLTDLGVEQSTDSIVFDPLIEEEFSGLFPLQYGTSVGDDIMDIGGAQGLPPGVTPGIGQGGAQVLIRGEVQTPTDVEGEYQVTIGPDTTTLLIDLGGQDVLGGADTTIGAGFTIQTLSDTDGDEVADEADNCPSVDNTGQEDGDGDEFGDACDNCPDEGNTGQDNADGDDYGDVCDDCTDTDGDGLGDPGFPDNICALDNCPEVSNAGQEDCDLDGTGDACETDAAEQDGDGDSVCNGVDNCPEEPNSGQGDGDGDQVGDACDNCPSVDNTGQEDADGDEFGDACDGCPSDANKVAAGICGCEVADTDKDGDNTPDCHDGCPGDASKTAPGVCGCGVVDSLADGDSDGVPDCIDPTPSGSGTGEGELVPVETMGCGAGVGLANLAGFWALCGAGLVSMRGRYRRDHR